jgi:hypothetical protein
MARKSRKRPDTSVICPIRRHAPQEPVLLGCPWPGSEWSDDLRQCLWDEPPKKQQRSRRAAVSRIKP